MIKFILFIIIVMLILFIYIFIPTTSTCKDLVIYKKILLSKVYNQIKIGDLVFFSSNKHNVLNRTLGHHTFSHMGIVLVDEKNKKYIYEIVEKDYFKPNSDTISNLSTICIIDRIVNYNGNIYISPLIKPLDDVQINKLNLFIKNKKDIDCKYPSKIRLYFLYLFLSSEYRTDRFCSELVSEILNLMDISDKPYNSKIYKMHREVINLCNNVIYYEPVHVIPDTLFIENMNSPNNVIKYC